MTDPTAPVPPTGLKAKAADVGLKAYLKAPPPVQNGLLKGYTKTQPVVAKVSPHAKKLAVGGLSLLLLRRLRRRHH